MEQKTIDVGLSADEIMRSQLILATRECLPDIAKNNWFKLKCSVEISGNLGSNDRYFSTHYIKIIADIPDYYLDEDYYLEEDPEDAPFEFAKSNFGNLQQFNEKLYEFLNGYEIGSIRIIQFNTVEGWYYEDEEEMQEMLSVADGESQEFYNIIHYFCPAEVKNELWQGLFQHQESNFFEVDHRGKILYQASTSPYEKLAGTTENIWHISFCGIDKLFRGYDLGVKALLQFFEIFGCSSDIIACVPYPPSDEAEEYNGHPEESQKSKKAKRSPEKTALLLRRYWLKLGLRFFNEKYNILWGSKAEVDSRFW
jgi:hypothetical protein